MPILSRHSLLPLTARLRATFQRIRSVPESAHESIELAAADEAPTLPAIALPNEFDRVLGVGPSSTIDAEKRIITAKSLKHGPTIAYRVDDAILADHTCYWSGGYEVSKARKKRALLTGAYDEYAEGQLCTYAPSNIYFGHWLRDAMAMELLAEQRGLLPLSFEGTPWMHELGYRQLMELPGHPISYARIRRLWVMDDLGLNSNWISRFKELRARVRRKTNTGGPRHIFLARGFTGTARELLNAPNIVELLSARGFTVVTPETLSPQAIVQSLAAAKIVVAVEGSALNHAQFALPEQAGVLVIQPPTRFNAFHKILFDFNRIRFGYLVAEPASNGFIVDPDRLLRTLDLIESELTKQAEWRY